MFSENMSRSFIIQSNGDQEQGIGVEDVGVADEEINGTMGVYLIRK